MMHAVPMKQAAKCFCVPCTRAPRPTPFPLKGEARQDRRQDRHACPVRHLPDGRGRRAEGIVRGNPAADRRTATKTGSSVGTEGVGCVITTGGVCLNDEEKGQTGLSGMVRAATNARSRADAIFGLRRTPGRVLSFTPIPGHLGNVGFRSFGAVCVADRHDTSAKAPE